VVRIFVREDVVVGGCCERVCEREKERIGQWAEKEVGIGFQCQALFLNRVQDRGWLGHENHAAVEHSLISTPGTGFPISR